jgi:hypothetical protein
MCLKVLKKRNDKIDYHGKRRTNSTRPEDVLLLLQPIEQIAVMQFETRDMQWSVTVMEHRAESCKARKEQAGFSKKMPF